MWHSIRFIYTVLNATLRHIRQRSVFVCAAPVQQNSFSDNDVFPSLQPKQTFSFEEDGCRCGFINSGRADFILRSRRNTLNVIAQRVIRWFYDLSDVRWSSGFLNGQGRIIKLNILILIR